VRWMAISNRPNAMHNFARLMSEQPPPRNCDEDLMG